MSERERFEEWITGRSGFGSICNTLAPTGLPHGWTFQNVWTERMWQCWQAALLPPACPTCHDTKRVPRSYSGGDAFESTVACPNCIGPDCPVCGGDDCAKGTCPTCGDAVSVGTFILHDIVYSCLDPFHEQGAGGIMHATHCDHGKPIDDDCVDCDEVHGPAVPSQRGGERLLSEVNAAPGSQSGAGPSQPPAADEVVVARGTMQDLDVCDDDLRTTVIIDALASNRPDLIALDGTKVEVIIRPTAARGERKK